LKGGSYGFFKSALEKSLLSDAGIVDIFVLSFTRSEEAKGSSVFYTVEVMNHGLFTPHPV
jgi:hypothetical protein